MEKTIREMFYIHSQLEEFQRKAVEAQNIIKKALSTAKKPYVAFSGGKDSTVMLHLILRYDPDITVFHFIWPQNIMPKGIEKEVLRNMRIIGAKNVIYRTERPNPQGSGFFANLMELQRQNFDTAFIGLRKEESCRRDMRIKNNSFYLKHIREIYPLQNWTWKDVWAYIVRNKLPYPKVYEEYSKLLGWDKARFVSFFDPEFERLGSSNVDGVLMWRYKHQR